MEHAHAGPEPRISLFLSKAPGLKAAYGALQCRPVHLNTPCQINVGSPPQEEEEEEKFQCWTPSEWHQTKPSKSQPELRGPF